MDSKIYKGSLETILLKLLLEKGEMYGYEITKSVKSLSDGKIQVKEGSLYPLLHRLEARGVITSEIRKKDNRARKYYKITEHGQTQSANLFKEMQDYLKIMQNVLNPKVI